MNCFLDEGSDTTYVNRDVIETLGISTQKEEITINVAKDQKVRLMAATLEIGLESVDGKVDTTIVMKTSDKICGGMKPTDRVTMKQEWNHLKDIPFPHLAEKGVIDVLLGSDYYHLMFPMKEIRGQEDEPAARLCPLGWTAIGRIGKSTHPRGTACANTGYLHTFRSQILSPDIVDIGNTSDEELNITLKRFWDLETVGIVTQTQEETEMTPLEKIARKKVDLDVGSAPQVYEFSRFVYCPFCALFTLQSHAENHKTQYPLATEAVCNHCYMDDLMPSVPTIDIAKET